MKLLYHALPFFLITWLNSWGAPACPEPFEAEHPGGGRHPFRLCGDEYFSWVEDEAGHVFTYDDLRCLRFARLENHRLLPAEGDTPPTPLLHRDDILAEARLARQLAQTAGGMVPAAIFSTGNDTPYDQVPPHNQAPAPHALLIILVSFSDITVTYPPGLWHSMVFDENGKTVNSYYKAVSKNQYYFLPAHETQGTTNDAVVHVTLPYAHPNTPHMSTAATRQVVRDALTAAADHVRFSFFDHDGNGTLGSEELGLLIILAGYEASYSTAAEPLIWAHNTRLPQPNTNNTGAPVLDGVIVGYNGNYAMIGERHGGINNAPIGIICHELAHSLGIWDLYDYDNSSHGIGTHGLMGAGSWGHVHGDTMPGQTPVFLCAFHRLLLGFSRVRTVETGTFTLTAASLAGTDDTDILKFQTSLPNEYFLIENRQPQGFDQGLQRYFGASETRGGIAIWHIDENKYAHLGNNDETHKAVDLEEANEQTAGHSQLDTRRSYGSRQHYFYDGHTTTFDDDTIPSARLYNGTPSGFAITHVGASANAMSLTLNAPTPGRPEDATASNALFYDRVRVQWQACAHATGYALFRAPETSPANITQISAVQTPLFDDMAAEQGRRYLYWVAATNGWGTGPFAGPVSGRVKTTNLDATLNPDFIWETGGDESWFVATAVTFDNNSSAQSGPITHRQSSWIQTTVTGPGVLSFNWNISCEPYYDILLFSINGSPLTGMTGWRVTDWSKPALFPIPGGTHTIRWTYQKDSGVDRGDDTARIANVQWYPAAVNSPVPVPHTWLHQNTSVLKGDTAAYETAALATGLNGIPLWQSYLAGLNPRDPGSHFTAGITLSNSLPRISWMPDLGTGRAYTLEGKASLSDAWGPTNAASRFFRVKVGLPGLPAF